MLTNNPYQKLHLGCGSKHIPGFFHIDALDHTNVQRQADVRNLFFVPDNSAELVYCSHVLEHFGRWEVPELLKEWYRVIQPGGILRLAVPNFKACVEIYVEDNLAGDIRALMGLICGGQKDEYDYHKSIFDEKYLTSLLLDSGFKTIELWDWRATEHSEIDDYSQAYLPHMDKENGKLMSLNIQAVK